MSDPVLTILRDARSIVDTGFCKGAYARRINGASCKPTDPRAVSHCALGAVAAAAGIKTEDGHRCMNWSDEANEALQDLRAVASLGTGGNIAEWNNRWYRTKWMVRRAFDRAIRFREIENAASEITAALTTERLVNRRTTIAHR